MRGADTSSPPAGSEETLPTSVWEPREQLARPEEEREVLAEPLWEKNLQSGSLSPTHIIPEDVWIEILQLASVHHFPECHSEHYHTDEFAMPMSRVSRYFRRLTQALPTLWACVHVTPGRLARCGSRWLEEQLRRSGEAPLTILFSCHKTDNLKFWDDWQQLRIREQFRELSSCWNLLLKEAGRWRRLTFLSRHHDLATELFSRGLLSGDISLPILEHVDVYVHKGFKHLPIRPAWDLTKLKAPCLRVVRGFGLPYAVRTAFNFRLTELVLNEFPGTLAGCDFAAILHSTASTLVTLILRRLTINDTDGLSALNCTLSIRHAYLDDIQLKDQRFSEFAASILKHAPQLWRLEVVASCTMDAFSSSLCRGVKYPSVKVLNLELHRMGIVSPVRFCPSTPFLTPFPGLEHLIISNDDCSPYIRTLLERSQAAFLEGIYLWPSLGKLTLDDCLATDTLQCLQAFIRHRAEMKLPLRVLDLSKELIMDVLRNPVGDFLEYIQERVTVTQVEHMDQCGMRRWNWRRGVPHVPPWIRGPDREKTQTPCPLYQYPSVR